MERGLDGGGDELRGLGVDGDVAAEQHAADDVAGVPGRVLRAAGHAVTAPRIRPGPLLQQLSKTGISPASFSPG